MTSRRNTPPDDRESQEPPSKTSAATSARGAGSTGSMGAEYFGEEQSGGYWNHFFTLSIVVLSFLIAYYYKTTVYLAKYELSNEAILQLIDKEHFVPPRINAGENILSEHRSSGENLDARPGEDEATFLARQESMTNSDVDLSIVIPAFNEEERLPVMLDEMFSYLAGKKRIDFSKKKVGKPHASDELLTYEIIVVDDCSSDKTTENLLKNYPKENVKVISCGTFEYRFGPACLKKGICQ